MIFLFVLIPNLVMVVVEYCTFCFLFITDVEVVVLESVELDLAFDDEVDPALGLFVVTYMIDYLSSFKSLDFHLPQECQVLLNPD